MIIAIADTHLGSAVSNEQGFRQFITQYLRPNQHDIECLILLGDILDLWRRPNPEVLAECRGILNDLSLLEMRKIYLVGNHDFEVLALGMMGSLDFPSTNIMASVSRFQEMKYDGLKLRFCHGHQVEYWPSLPFYESFCKAMCYYDPESDELSNLWTLMERFAKKEAPEIIEMIEALPSSIRDEFEATFAGPLHPSTVEQKPAMLREWQLLSQVSSIDELSLNLDPPHREMVEAMTLNASKTLGVDIQKRKDPLDIFAHIWENLANIVGKHESMKAVPEWVRDSLHQIKRIAAMYTIGLKPDEFLIRGHGHSLYSNTEHRVADAGCWLGERASYLEIAEGRVEARIWKH